MELNYRLYAIYNNSARRCRQQDHLPGDDVASSAETTALKV